MIIYIVQSKESSCMEAAFSNIINAEKYCYALGNDCYEVLELEVKTSFVHPEVVKNNEKIEALKKEIRKLLDKNIALIEKGA